MCNQISNVGEILRAMGTMPTKVLLEGARELESQVKRNEALLIAHISEIARRKAHLDLGYADLFNYVTKELRVAEGAAACRIQVAGVCQRFPQILQKLAAGDITLTVAGRISPVVTAENCDFLLEKCRGLSSREVLSLLADLALRRETEHKPSLRKISASSGNFPASSGNSSASSMNIAGEPGGSTAHAAVEDVPTSVAPETVAADKRALPPPAAVVPLILMQEGSAARAADRYNLKLSISAELKEKIERLAAVIGIDDAVSQIEKVIDRAVNDSLARRDPVYKERRRAKRERRALAHNAKETMGIARDSHESQAATCARKVKAADATPSNNRYIPAQVRDAALLRAGYRCEFVSEEGRRCEARHGLQIDHINPIARGGAGELSNVQVLCRGHNLRKAEHDLGEDFMRGVVAEKRRATEQCRVLIPGRRSENG